MGFRREYAAEFEAIWKVYPNKANKLGAEKSWQKLKFTAEENALLIAHIVERAKTDPKWRPDAQGNSFIPHLQTFINQRRWEDEYKAVPTKMMDRYERANQENQRRREAPSAYVPQSIGGEL